MQKWNWKTHRYETMTVPDNWYCRTYSPNLDEMVNCPHCGRKLPFGETYTSQEIHDWVGFGYAVCGDCYEAEWARRRQEMEEEVRTMETEDDGNDE